MNFCAIFLLFALTTPSWGKDPEAFPNLNLNDPRSVQEATRVLEEELKLAARPHTYVLIDLVGNTIQIKGRGVELHHMPIVQWSVGSWEKLSGIHRLVARPQVVRRRIEPGKGDEQEPISLADMPTYYDLSFSSGLTINVAPLAAKDNLVQAITLMGKSWWRRLKNWTSMIGTDQPSTSAAPLEVTVSVDHAQSLAWSLVDGMAVLIRRSADQ
ncbi:MAG: hypothetical protein AB7L09_07545 [Nitrospira sp.]